jgi:hypothetical protein
MKLLVFITLLSVNISFIFTQINILISDNFDIYKPYTETAQEYLKDQKVRSNTSTFQVMYPIHKGERFNFKLGFSYKLILLRNKEMATQIGYKEYSSGGYTFYIVYPANIDLVSRSHSLGVPISVSRNVYSKEKKNIDIGSQIDVYFIEYFRAKYKRKNFVIYEEPYISRQVSSLNLVSSQLTIFSTYKYAYNNRSSIGIRLQAGTNLYSNWDQFKRYAWLGVGLEWEIGKKVKNGN